MENRVSEFGPNNEPKKVRLYGWKHVFKKDRVKMNHETDELEIDFKKKIKHGIKLLNR